jgi:SAM-dependent methyltransferase
MSLYERMVALNLRLTPFRPVHPSWTYFDVVSGYVSERTTWLDIGCGKHIFRGIPLDAELSLIARARTIHGIDPSSELLAQNRSIPPQNLVCGTAYELPWPDNTFDLITSSMVFEHLDAPQRCLNEARRVLKPGGVFVIATPNKWAYDTMAARLMPSFGLRLLTSLLDRRSHSNIFPTYYRCNDRRAFRRCAQGAGLHVADLRFLLSPGVLFACPVLYQLEMAWMAVVKLVGIEWLRPNVIAVLKRTNAA